jgi:hypothetical protein
MSGLLTAMMAFLEGTQLGLDFGIVEVDGGNFTTAKFITKARSAQPSQFGSFAQRKLANLKEPNGQFETQWIFNGRSRFPARQQKVVRILQGQLSHESIQAIVEPQSISRRHVGGNLTKKFNPFFPEPPPNYPPWF